MATTAFAWSLHELGLANFNDERLNKRAVQISSAFLEHPQSSIPQASRDWATTKATYRFFDNTKVKSDIMLRSHHKQLLERVADCDIILVAQDTMTINLSNKEIAGLGSIGDGGHGSGSLRGLFVHSGLAMNTDGIPLGLTSQKIYARKDETKTAAYKRTVKGRPISEKETFRWVEAVDQAKAVLTDQHVVMVGDRESDIYEVFRQGQELGVDMLVRTNQNRLLCEVDQTTQQPVKLFDKARTGDITVTYETDVPMDHHKTRKVTLTIRQSNFSLPPPKTRSKNEAWNPIPLTILNVMEENPPEGAEPIHWLLTTSLPVTTPEEAIEKVQWYMYRWRIERFHYTLKTGAFNIEKLQLETFDRFAKAITMYSIVAARIIYTVYYEREHPNEPAETNNLFSKHELQALRLREQTRILTIHQAVIATAKLGGHLARKSDGPPGIKSLWIGFRALQYLVEGMLLGRQMADQGLPL